VPRTGRAIDFLDDYRVIKDRVRRLELRQFSSSILHTHNFIISGPIGTGTYIPPAYVAVADTQQIILQAFGHFSRVGFSTIGINLIRGATVEDAPIGFTLEDGDKIQPIIEDSSGVEDLTIWYTLLMFTY
jgi:hypothetical protein